MKILVADDDPVSLRMVTGLLQSTGLDVIPAADGEAAWQQIQAGEPAMVVLDWLMPHVDGLELCRRIRQMPIAQRPYVVMVTEKDSTDDLVAALAMGADDYVTKPFSADELRARLAAGMRLVFRDRSLVHETEFLKNALSRLHTLPELPTICSSCKQVRADDGTWTPVDRFVSQHTGIHFSHGFCPDCYARYGARLDPEEEGDEPPSSGEGS